MHDALYNMICNTCNKIYDIWYRSMIYWYDIPYDMIYNIYNKICDTWYMIIDYIIIYIWYMYMHVWNDMHFHVWYDKEQYMTYNMEVWYADMIYHMTWYMIHTII